MAHITSLAVPTFADWCAFDLVDDDGSVRTVSVAHADPRRLHDAKLLNKKYPIKLDAPHGAAETIRTGRAQLSPDVTDDLLARVAQDEEHLRILRDLRLASFIVVPVPGFGRILGALSLATTRDSGRRYGPAELGIAEHLGRRAGLAIVNARVHQHSQEASRLRDQVLAVVSHDLRNPLAVVSLSAGTFRKRAEELSDRALLKKAETIKRAADRMEHLIADLLDMASIRAGGLKVEVSPQEIEPLVREAVDQHQPFATEKGVTLVFVSEAENVAIRCDRQRILQMLSNLLGNALKFCSRGDRVAVRVRREGGEVRLEVADTGPGIPPADQAHIFDAYWSSERRGNKGNGLGLFIAKGIVTAHGGRIWIDSEPGEGSTFVVSLPAIAG
jgi:signal transduction histidine kinase